MSQQSSDNLVWLDLEMTGLDVERHRIVQAAVIVTNRELIPLEKLSVDVWQPENVLAEMGPFVRRMHQETGLLERVRVSQTDENDAERQLLGLIARWCPYPATLCGNSIWQDRKFIDRYMPGLGRYLHYRMLDVSALKVLASRWYGDAAVYKKPSAGQHDALVDITNSIDELAHYRDTLMKSPN